MAKPILILRAKSDAPPMVERLKHLEYAPILNPLISHVPHPAAQAHLEEATNVDALIITSAHALDNVQLTDAVKALPCYCVGQRTAAAAIAAGIAESDIFDNSELLNDRLKMDNVERPLYLRGEHITQLFNNTVEIITYSAESISEVTEEATSLLDSHSTYGIAFTSGRLVHLWSLLLEEHGLESSKEHAIAFCMSELIATQASLYGFHKNYASAEPHLESLYTTIQSHY